MIAARQRASRNWPTATAHGNRRLATVGLWDSFWYMVNGQRYDGRTVQRDSSVWFSNDGTTFDVRFDPENPAVAIAEGDVSARWLGGAGLVFILGTPVVASFLVWLNS
jgi:hypothetical protein